MSGVSVQLSEYAKMGGERQAAMMMYVKSLFLCERNERTCQLSL